MVGAMGTRRLSINVVPREKWSLKSLFHSQFDSAIIEKKYNLNYLKKIYPSSHRLLVIILISHALINLIEIFAVKSISEKKNIIQLSLLSISISLNILSLIIIKRLKNRILSNIISFICICPLGVISCLYPEECHIYLLIILIYTLANFSLLLSILISILIIVDITVFTLTSRMRLVLLLISNMIGIYLNRLLDITMRSAYNQLCKNANVRGTLSTEHRLISKMIDSLMPPKYAKVIMEDFDVFRERVQNVNLSRQGEDDLQMTTFRPLHIERMENVSILFADIVGFTHMSSNKSASQLVSLLSDLYGRFDDLCVQMSCEKIATLGDCYYCVSGCPEPRLDHARACVLMGLAMINAIEEFDEDNHEQVDMRVGVHSGSVNCGIVGTKKFKFDIFSNDVTLANKMESTGKPGFVHITEATHTLLKEDEFQFEEGPPFILPSKESIKTYFIGKRHLTHRITRKPPHMTLATAAAVAVASGVSLAIPLNETNDISNQSESVPVTSPLLEEVVQARRATICEEQIPECLENLGNVENVNEKTFEKEEKELVMSFNFLTLKYKDKRLENKFSTHAGPHSLLIVEVILSILSILFIYIYFPKQIITSIIMIIIIGIKLILTLILIRFHRPFLDWWILRHFIAAFYLLSPLIIILIQNSNYYYMTPPVFILFISTYLILGASLSHLIKILIAILSIAIYIPIIHFKQATNIMDISVCILIALIVLYGISRQVEVARRSQYHVVHKSSEQRNEIEKERERADWLLRNILPEHVIEPLRLLSGSYSCNHPCVGVLFASLINFHVMYEEQYEGGKFYARILNEFYGDIEELFLEPRFSKIEKIKTIGSTFMAASGLQTDSDDQNPLESVCDLVEFALAFQSTMHLFNEALLNFAFELRMGLNFGPVTAGVIGTTKLFYDIWGDTVNVASRMDSTGEKGRIQVPEHVAIALKDKYKFELRGEIDVKGKSRMTTYFLIPN
ncbi:unnamed protein product [Rotaria sp. Silwood1]|nr:unnamed protein product [Rotaria sp. Silwood1]CAF1416109.1 unnamed protein product [Rotaria sp. Silwood1]CAF4793093.1 unnamed protein product [Rotaria sp. Silwood1]